MDNLNSSTKMFPSASEFDKAKDDRFSQAVHQKLKRASVAIAGAGGLGSNIAVMLARSGVGHLHIVDFDIVDITNLNRQVYTVRHIGSRKVDAINEILMEINPYMKVTTDCVRVVVDNCEEIFRGYDIVCEAFDGAESKAMLIDSLLTAEDGPIVISGSGMAGYGSANEIRSRRITDRLFICGDEGTDIGDGIGLMAPRVAICAGHQANLVIGHILGADNI